MIKFNPIVSIVKKSIIGFEGVHNVRDDAFSSKDMDIESDRYIREQVIKPFGEFYNDNNDILLFLNIDISLISDYVGSGVLMNLVNSYNIDYKNVVLQIMGDSIDSIDVLKQFIGFYREKGFLVSLSNIGSGISNLDNISHVEPDIIRVSKEIIKDIEIDYYKQEVFKSLVSLSKNIGALVIADGIESEQQALLMIELGADMIQGDYFEKFNKLDIDQIKSTKLKIQETASKYKNYMIEHIEMEKKIHSQHEEILHSVLNNLKEMTTDKFNHELNTLIQEYNAFECIYVLDEKGIQVTDTLTNLKNMLYQKALIFKPAKINTDHSVKKYCYFLTDMGLDKYVTEPYISLATGNLCITMSEKFKNAEDKEFILCIDFNPNYINF